MTQVTGRRRSGRRGSRRALGKVLPSDARRHHLALVLQQLFDDGPRSRADLARETGLTRVTVSDLVAEFLGTELGHRPGVRQGKPATLVGLSDTAPVVIALDLSGHGILRGALVDLSGTILHAGQLPLPGGEAAVEQVLALARSLRERATRTVLRIGIGTP